MAAFTEAEKYADRSKWWRRLSPVNALGLVLLCSQPAWSHGAIATVKRTFSVEANYASGQPMASAQVLVYSPESSNQPWATGQTDSQGNFEFNPDTPGDWQVVIRQAGHGTTVNVPVETQVMAQVKESPTATPAASSNSTSTAAINSQTVAMVSSSESLASPLQRWVTAGAAFWGLIGTVLFFSRGKNS